MTNETSMPLAGPSTYEEALSRIKEAEIEMSNNGGSAWEDVMQEARQNHC